MPLSFSHYSRFCVCFQIKVPIKSDKKGGFQTMTEKHLRVSRRKFMIMSSAAAAAPLLLNNLTGMVPEAKAAAKKGTKVYYINRTCIGCQVCRIFCPSGAIHFGDCRNEIDQTKCIHCGTCYRECPVSVISETEI
jgi:ferredoxin